MDIWSTLCPNISTSNHHRVQKLSKQKSSSTDSRLAHTPKRCISASNAATKRLSFSIAHKLGQSLPSATLMKGSSSTDLFRQYSLEDVAMQNNYTVISNKVGPVIIKNCKEEYQMRHSDRNVMGRMHELSTEHELLLDKFFLLKDNFIGVDRHDTLEEHGVPNLRVVGAKPTIYAIGQPTMIGLEKFTNKLLEKHGFVYYINVRPLPTLFLRRSGDFLPYSAYSADQKENTNLFGSEREVHDAEREMQLQALKIANSNSGAFYYYNTLDSSPDDPHMYQTNKMEDLVTSRQLYSKMQSDHQNFKYKRLVLPNNEDPSAEWMDSLLDVMKEIKSHEDGENFAVVFQCLTGEGSALLAAIVALLSTENDSSTRTSTEQEMYDHVVEMQNELHWREYAMWNMLESSSLESMRKEVDLAIARICTPEAIYSINSDVASQNSYLSMIGGKSITLIKMSPLKGSSKSLCMRSDSMANITLREVSELNLHTTRSDSESRFAKRIRHEVTDEERLMKMLLLQVDVYYYLLLFRAYITEQGPVSFQKRFSCWLVHNPKFIFDLSQACSAQRAMVTPTNSKWELRCRIGQQCDIPLDPTFHRITGCPVYGIAQTTKERFENIVKKLCGTQFRGKYNRIEFINLRDDFTFYSSTPKEKAAGEISQVNGTSYTTEKASVFWELPVSAIPCMFGARAGMAEKVEGQLCKIFTNHPECVSFRHPEGVSQPNANSWKTTKQIIDDIKADVSIKEQCDSVNCTRIPLPRHRIPRFACFDQLVRTVRNAAENSERTAFVFFCHNGKKRTTNMMVAASLVLAHMEKFSLGADDSSTNGLDLWAPDVEFTRGEYKIILELIQILPDCHLRKKEVDVALDICHEGMSTMHYHLREHLNPTYKKARRAKDFEEYLVLKHRAYLGLEFYAFLIIFNCYLHQEKETLWRKISFTEWMSKYASRLGVLDVLNNLGFTEFGEDYPMNLLKSRWMDTSTLVKNIIRDSLQTDEYGGAWQKNGTTVNPRQFHYKGLNKLHAISEN